MGLGPVDVLAFGPHPDDIEIGMGATVAEHVARGMSVGLCDLTRGEMGSNGTIDERLREAESAREVLGAAWRENLALPDRQLGDIPDQVRAVAGLIRTARPSVVAAPYWEDRHPDHIGASRLVTAGAFSAGLRRFSADGGPWKPDWIVYYFINNAAPPSFLVDVSEFYEVKQRALACHRSQFAPTGPDAANTRLTSPLFNQLVESRDAQFGALAGVRWAEGFVVREPLMRRSLLKRRPTGAPRS